MNADLPIQNARVLTLAGEAPRRGDAMNAPAILPQVDAAVMDGSISAVGAWALGVQSAARRALRKSLPQPMTWPSCNTTGVNSRSETLPSCTVTVV